MVSDHETMFLLPPSSSSSPSLPNVPVDLIPDILSRLPVKSLLQFRCVCKSWKSLISHPEFAKKHLTLSTRHTIHCVSQSSDENIFLKYGDYVLKSYSLDSSSSVWTNITQTQYPQTQFPLSRNRFVYFNGSCNGILCLSEVGLYCAVLLLWNPSIRKFKELPLIGGELEPHNDFRQPKNYEFGHHKLMSGFGYDLISDNYKIVVVLLAFDNFAANYFSKNKVKVHTLGTNSWKSVSVFPFTGLSVQQTGQYVCGTINWLVSTGTKEPGYLIVSLCKCFIASYDLGKESYQKVSLPDVSGEVDKYPLHLSVFRDCLCLIFGEDVWVMKEYGNNESWTKLFTISNMRDSLTPSYSYIKAIYVFEDHQVLLVGKRDDLRWMYISYSCKNDTSKFIEFDIGLGGVCIESLISPCF